MAGITSRLPGERSVLVFFVNGKKIMEPNVDAEMTLLQYLRDRLYYRGTKLVCREGGCGACTVMVSKLDRGTDNIRHFTVNSCIAPVCSMHGLAVITVEGIGSTSNGLHPVQDRLAKCHGSQCGFCTPGMVMTMYTLLRNNPQPTALQLEQAFDGNLCRCTGYRPIIDGFKTFTKEYCAMGEQCCRNKDVGGSQDRQYTLILPELFNSSDFIPFDPTQEAIFPPELQMTSSYDKESLVFVGESVTWLRPVTLDHVLRLKAQYPQARIMDIGIDKMFYTTSDPVMISTSCVPELGTVDEGPSGVTFGAAVTISIVHETLKAIIDKLPEERTRTLRAMEDMLQLFGGPQIRNVATIGGSLVTASPISDMNTLFMATRATVLIQSNDGGKRVLNIDERFFIGFRQNALTQEELIVSITIPYSHKNQYVCGYKQSHRRCNDVAIVNAGLSVQFIPDTDVIDNVLLSFGGMASTTVLASSTMARLVGMNWNDDLLERVCQLLPEELALPPEAPGGMAEYRRTLSLSFFFKFYLMVRDKLGSLSDSTIDSSYQSAFRLPAVTSSQSCQVFEEVSSGQLSEDPVGRPCKSLSAEQQATGEAIYIDDMPRVEGELCASLVLSSKAHAKLLHVDPSEALKMPGVVDYVSANDVTGSNDWGPIVPDEEIFARQKVYAEGQVIGVILADTQTHAQKAAREVTVQYEQLEHILTSQEAKLKCSYHGQARTLCSGDVEAGFAESDHVIEGTCDVGGQEHFYFETQSCIALPRNENGEMEIFSSTQNPKGVQNVVADALGVTRNRIIVRVKRIGGGFGGKITRSSLLAAIAAVAANKHRRAVRLVLDRKDDMLFSGKRHPISSTYKVGFKSNGKLSAVDIHMYVNAGWSRDVSPGLIPKALLRTDNCYYFPNFRMTGYVCKTNTPSNTPCRGFGGPQAMLICENIMDNIAATYSLCPVQVREMNMYKDGDVTPYRQTLQYCNARTCWQDCLEQSDFYNQQDAVRKYNRENRWTKRGIYMIPTKFSPLFDLHSGNQAGALVHVYTDGSVLLAPSGVEMGQGLYTKLVQIASRALGISASYITISETGTNTVPNTSPTAASVSTDINGMAVLNACETIVKRLDAYITAKPEGQWEDWVKTAYSDQISLSATGFYKIPDLEYNLDKNEGKAAHHYFCYGSGCSVVQIDCLTGDHQILRTDIVMDVGSSLNPAIDIGQIEGAFIQGYGFMCLEQQKFSPSGNLLTHGLHTYKIPSMQNIPKEFNVSLLKGKPNPKAIYSSKAVGEPPLFLASSILFAIKDAIKSARRDAGLEGNFQLNSPVTPERIRMACVDQFTQKSLEADAAPYTPWFITLT